MKNIIDIGVASDKINAVVTDVQLISVLRPNDRLQQKIVLHVKDEATENIYKVSDAWTDFGDDIAVRALWFFETPDGIYAQSTLAKSMKFYKLKNLKDFIGKTVKLYPDKNQYLTLVMTDRI
jgi:hypothetical protein